MRREQSPSRRILRNGFFLLLLTLSNYFIGLLLFPYISRVLSVEGFGLIGFSMAFALFFQVIVDYGFMISSTATVSKHRNDMAKVSNIVTSVIYAKIILAGVSLLLFCLAAVFIPIVRDNLAVVSLFVISSIFTALMPDFFFRGIEQMKSITIRTVIVKTLTLVLVILLVRDESQILLIPAAFLVSNVLAVIVAFTIMYRIGLRPSRVSVNQILQSIRESSMFFISRIAARVNQSAGTFIVGLKFAPTSIESGMFSAATRVSSAGEMMVLPVSDSLYPHMVNKKDYRLFRKVIIAGGLAWFIVCLVVFVFANDVCRIVLGPDYAQAGDLLRILIFGSFMGFFSNMFGYNALTPIGKASYANAALLVSAVVNLIAFGVLWAIDAISLITVCIVLASTNLVVFCYRATIFWRSRHLIVSSK